MGMDWFEDQRFIDSIRHHFVALSGKCIRVDSSGAQVGQDENFVFSAFVVRILGRWCLVTAGHVIRNIDDIVAHPEWRLLRCGLGDYFNPHAKVKEPTPFDFEGAEKISVDRDGIDIGLIPLRDFYRDSVAANGIEPIPVAPWEGDTPPECEAYCVLGLPKESTHRIEASSSRGSGTSALLTLIPLIPEGEAVERPADSAPQFVATLFDGNELKSAVGLSGGPIIGLRKGDESPWKYSCLAVQGSWDKVTRKVFGTPMGLVVKAIIQALAQQRAAQPT